MDLNKLLVPQHPVDVVLDTDTYNEIDDQFALAYLLKSTEKLHTVGLCAAPFYNENSSSPADGMEKSYEEILHLLRLMGLSDLSGMVRRGSDRYLPDEQTPVPSEAASFMAELADSYIEYYEAEDFDDLMSYLPLDTLIDYEIISRIHRILYESAVVKY